MIPPVACQFVSKNLSLFLQSNYFCWHPSTFTSFQMDLMSLSLSMRAFECLPLQDFCCYCCCCCYFCLSFGAASSQTSNILCSQNPRTLGSPAFANCGSINGNFQDDISFDIFLSTGIYQLPRNIYWQIETSILSEIVAVNGPWHWSLQLPAPKGLSVCTITKHLSLRTNLLSVAISSSFQL